MTDTQRSPRRSPSAGTGLDPGMDSGGGRWPLRLAAVAGAGNAALAGLWLGRPEWNGYADPGSALLRTWLSAPGVSLVHLALGLLGLLAAGVALAYLAVPQRPWPRWLVAVGALQAAGVGLGLLGTGVVMAAGYLMALAVPIGVLMLVVQLVSRGGAGRWGALAAVMVVVGGGVLVGVISSDSLAVLDSIRDLPVMIARESWVAFGLVATALTWAVIVLRAARSSESLDRFGAWVLRHRRAITVLAALGPLPYALVRLTWLTPWPLLGPTGGDLTADVRLWGLMLSGGAWAGVVLTLGLIQRWGEVFPRWMAGVAGRPVPVWFAAVPGGVVATVLCASAVPMVQQFSEVGPAMAVVSALVFPFWFWGPMLALAIWGYVLHRQQPARAEV